jgi:hypothetical protein
MLIAAVKTWKLSQQLFIDITYRLLVNSFQLFKKIRIWLYVSLGILFILDFRTTEIGVNQGLRETNWILANFVNNSILHFSIKILFCLVLIGWLEYNLIRDVKTGKCENGKYFLFILCLVCVIVFFMWVVLQNVVLIRTS